MAKIINVHTAGIGIGNIVPVGQDGAIPSGTLLCDGSAVSRTTYLYLFSKIGTRWGIGDGSTTFNLPDLRGKFPRGRDIGAGNDPDTASRTAINGGASGDAVGSVQGHAFASHAHGFTGLNGGTGAAAFPPGGAGSTLPMPSAVNANGGNETRPINVYVDWAIAYI